MKSYQDLIDKLNLIPHPEGGYYRRNWQSLFNADIKDSTQKLIFSSRTIGSSILYLLPGDDVSVWHRVNCDEMWHHYSGTALKVYTLSPQKGLETFILGSDVFNGEVPQLILHRHTWFAAEPIDTSLYALCGCTLWPAFSYTDFELAETDKLIDEYPAHRELILNIAGRKKQN